MSVCPLICPLIVQPMTDEQAHTLIGLGGSIVRALPPAMVLLVLLNVGFLVCTMWVVQHNADARNTMLARIIDTCMEHRP
jgi:hypothetical protein